MGRKRNQVITALLCLPFIVSGRIWTNTDGVEIEADLVQILEDSVVLKVGYSEYTVPFETLSEADLEYIEKQRLASEKAAEPPNPDAAKAYQKRVENSLLKNSDFSSSAGWSGGSKRTIEEPDGSKISVYRVNLSNRDETISQDFERPDDLVRVKFEMRYRVSEDFRTDHPGPGSVVIRMKQPKNRTYTYFDRAIKPVTKGWETLSFTFNRMSEADDWVLEILFRPGDGEVLIRDIFLDPIWK